MRGAVCPACGVALVPGYVRCPKCHRPLPLVRTRDSISPVGGTTLDGAEGNRRSTLQIAFALIVAAGIVAWFALRTHTTSEPPPPITTSPGVTPGPAAVPTNAPPTQPPETGPVPTAPKPDTIAADLERTLKRQHLWATVGVVGDHVDIRSGSCSDAGMKAAIAAVAGSFKAANLTRARCVDSSGTVVSTIEF